MTDEVKSQVPPCEYCGKEFGPKVQEQARNMHVMACERKVALKKAEADSANAVEESAIEKDKRRAKAVAEVRRKQAPKIQANPVSEPDPLRELERYAKDMSLCAKDAHIYMGDMTKHDMNVNKGYAPVTEHGEHLGYGDVKMYEIPDAVYKAELHRTAALSNNAIYSQVHEAQSTQNDDEAKIAKAVKQAVAEALAEKVPA